MTKDIIEEEVTFNEALKPTCVAMAKTITKSKFMIEGP